MHDPLFRPLTIGSLTVKNRIVMPAMHMNMCSGYEITEGLVEFYRRRAKGGAGLICVGFATVDELSGNPGNIGAHEDRFLPGLAGLAEAMQSEGAACGVQLNHAGRYNHSTFLGGRKPVAPSPVASRLTGEKPRQLELNEIEEVQQNFARAAQRVKGAGYDMVEVLAGTGYLISEFLSPLTNKRQDRYGGSLENRMRFGLEIIEKVRGTVGSFPVIVRINGDDFMSGGIGRAEMETFAAELVMLGVDALCVNVGWHEAKVPQIVSKVPRGVFAYLSRAVKRKVDVPVIASHRINDPHIARRLIGEEFCDMVAMGRALIADPDLPEKVKSGREGNILHCVACGQGCFDNLLKMKPVECLCNPHAGHEKRFQDYRISSPRYVLIAGGGPAGINCALAASTRGHRVRIFEKSMTLGGQLKLAGASPGRKEFHVLAEDLVRQLEESNVEVVLNTEVDGHLLLREKPDILIVATGGEPLTPDIDGVEQEHVVQAWNVLSGAHLQGKDIVIIGGGAVGVETALKVAEKGTLSGEELKFLLLSGAVDVEELKELASRGSKSVSLVDLQEKLGTNFGKSTRWSMLQDLSHAGCEVYVQTKVMRITENEVVIEQNGSEMALKADSVILAVGTASHNPLEKVAAELGLVCQVVGDAHKPATVLRATHHGYRAGWGIE